MTNHSSTPAEHTITSAELYHDALGCWRVAIRYDDDLEEDRPASTLERHLLRSETPLVGWRPMDTAPKDGSKFLIVCATDEEPEIEVCDWFEMEDWHWERLSEDTYRKVVTGKRGQWNSNGHRATHWMPLPEVPLVHR